MRCDPVEPAGVVSSLRESPSTWKRQSSPYLAWIASASACRVSRSVTRAAVPSTTTSCPRFQVLPPVVSATSGEWARLRAFCSSWPVMNQAAPSCQAPIRGVTWGRPSARTVVSQ